VTVIDLIRTIGIGPAAAHLGEATPAPHTSPVLSFAIYKRSACENPTDSGPGNHPPHLLRTIAAAAAAAVAEVALLLIDQNHPAERKLLADTLEGQGSAAAVHIQAGVAANT